MSSNRVIALDGFSVGSSTFTNQYNGDDIYDGAGFINDWSAAGGTVTPILGGTVLTVDLPDSNGWIQQDSGASDWENIGASSWTLEAQLTLVEDQALTLWADPTADSNGLILYIHENGTGSAAGGTQYSADSNLGTHTYRLAYESGADNMQLWRDDILLFQSYCTNQPRGWTAFNRWGLLC